MIVWGSRPDLLLAPIFCLQYHIYGTMTIARLLADDILPEDRPAYRS